MIPILQPEQRWECPNCDLIDVTHEAQPHSRMHPCPGVRGLTAPMVPEGTKCKVVAEVREDYVGKELVTCDEEKKPIAAINITRDEGNDVFVFAPCATGKVG